MSKREAPEPQRKPRRFETLRAFAGAILLALAIRSFVVEPFTIPSGSMIPTLLVGDFILVNKFTYGIRLPIIDTLLIPVGEPERGDVIVFRYPDDPSQDFIKRVVGLPGDRVEVRDGRVFLNGQVLDRLHKGTCPYYEVEQARTVPAEWYLELDGNGARYTVIQNPARVRRSRRGPWQVPEGHYFMMGDNRDNSRDSREWRQSFVRADQLKGRAWIIHWSWIVVSGELRPQNPILSLFDTLWRVVSFQIEDVRWERIFRPVVGPVDACPESALD